MKILEKIKLPLSLMLFLAMVSIIRFSFLGKGALGISDEWRYDESLRLLSFLAKQEWQNLFNAICNTQGRPADVIIRLPDALLQTIFYKITGKEAYHPISLLIPTSINVLVNFLIGVVFYKLSHFFLRKDDTYALSATIVFCLLVNNNLYIRHILPYDYSLLFFFLALCMLLISKQSPKSFFMSGFFSALSFSTYPGYYGGVVVIGILALFNIIKSNKSPFLKQLIFFGLGFASIFSMFEVLHQIVQKSYILNLSQLSSSITQGAFEEGFTFIFKYLVANDYAVGFLLIVADIIFLLTGIASFIKNRYQVNLTQSNIIFISVLFIFLFHVSSSVFFHRMVFYGRLAHFYFPFMVLAAFVGLQNFRYKKYIAGILVATASCSFFYFINQFNKIDYPRDVLAKYGITAYLGDPLSKPTSITPQAIYEIGFPSFKILSISKNIENFKLVNFAYFYPLENNYQAYTPLPTEKLLYQSTHFQFFTPYCFEGFNPTEREIANKIQMKIKVYQIEK
jgi:hypothetical protein